MSNEVWEPDQNPHQARRIGKTAEEVNELGAVLARISIQGLRALDPASMKSNKQRLLEEMADVTAQIELTLEFVSFDVNKAYFAKRVEKKKLEMRQWEAHFVGNK